MLKNKGKIATIEDWNSYFNRSLKEKIKGDLFLVFEEEEKNYDEWLTLLNQNLKEHAEEDFLKFVCNIKTKKESKKASSAAQNVHEEEEEYSKRNVVYYKKYDMKQENKKEELKSLKEELYRLVQSTWETNLVSPISKFKVSLSNIRSHL